MLRQFFTAMVRFFKLYSAIVPAIGRHRISSCLDALPPGHIATAYAVTAVGTHPTEWRVRIRIGSS